MIARSDYLVNRPNNDDGSIAVVRARFTHESINHIGPSADGAPRVRQHAERYGQGSN